MFVKSRQLMKAEAGRVSLSSFDKNKNDLRPILVYADRTPRMTGVPVGAVNALNHSIIEQKSASSESLSNRIPGNSFRRICQRPLHFNCVADLHPLQKGTSRSGCRNHEIARSDRDRWLILPFMLNSSTDPARFTGGRRKESRIRNNDLGDRPPGHKTGRRAGTPFPRLQVNTERTCGHRVRIDARKASRLALVVNPIDRAQTARHIRLSARIKNQRIPADLRFTKHLLILQQKPARSHRVTDIKKGCVDRDKRIIVRVQLRNRRSAKKLSTTHESIASKRFQSQMRLGNISLYDMDDLRLPSVGSLDFIPANSCVKSFFNNRLIPEKTARISELRRNRKRRRNKNDQ